MKLHEKHLLHSMRNTAVWISCIAAALFCGRASNAAVIMTLDQVGPNVVATGAGTVNTAGLIFNGVVSTLSSIFPSQPILEVGPAWGTSANADSMTLEVGVPEPATCRCLERALPLSPPSHIGAANRTRRGKQR